MGGRKFTELSFHWSINLNLMNIIISGTRHSKYFYYFFLSIHRNSVHWNGEKKLIGLDITYSSLKIWNCKSFPGYIFNFLGLKYVYFPVKQLNLLVQPHLSVTAHACFPLLSDANLHPSKESRSLELGLFRCSPHSCLVDNTPSILTQCLVGKMGSMLRFVLLAYGRTPNIH
jgi:hypothetical protein